MPVLGYGRVALMSVARHTLYNVSGALAPVAVSLVTVPLYLKLVGLERYGLLALCWLLVGYFGLFDFGIGRATAQRIARLEAASGAERSRAFWTGASISLALALVATLIAIPLAPTILSYIDAGSSDLRGELNDALPILVLAVPIAIIQSVLRGALEGRREFLTVNLLFTIAAVATGGLPLVAAAIWGPQLPQLIATSFGARAALLAALAIACRRRVPVKRFERPAREEVRSTLHFGAWLTVTNVVGPLMVIFDRFLIGAIIGSAAVAVYVIPFNLISQLLLVPAALGNALFPSLAVVGRSADLNRKALLATTFFITPVTLLAVLLLGPFLQVWIGGTTAQASAKIGLVLIIGGWANALAQLPHVSLQAEGRTDVTAKVHLAEVAPYLLMLWLGVSTLGVLGAAIAWSVRAIIDFVALAWLDCVGAEVLRRALLQGSAVLALALIMLTTDGGSIVRWPLVALTCGAALFYLVRTLPPELAQRLSNAARRASS